MLSHIIHRIVIKGHTLGEGRREVTVSGVEELVDLLTLLTPPDLTHPPTGSYSPDRAELYKAHKIAAVDSA